MQDGLQVHQGIELTAIGNLTDNLSLSAAVNYNGSSYDDPLSTDRVPGYTLFDIGARYDINIANSLVTLRADLHNLTNEHYWNGFNSTRIGDPRALGSQPLSSFSETEAI